MDPHRPDHSDIFIANGLLNRQFKLFQLFNNVPRLLPTLVGLGNQTRFPAAARRLDG